ncbi:hypothetical protein B0J11DRAFT_584290 [Dendryphion nanum]|uniref:Uncharacterized protein n=1 Tax=Dendryphion nanum TaxID=256645 RepID=A0A9P9DBS1_9PLEO|nr:hypothetical protein B0J11DRAFT_584290 [Dendryphion nanum]
MIIEFNSTIPETIAFIQKIHWIIIPFNPCLTMAGRSKEIKWVKPGIRGQTNNEITHPFGRTWISTLQQPKTAKWDEETIRSIAKKAYNKLPVAIIVVAALWIEPVLGEDGDVRKKGAVYLGTQPRGIDSNRAFEKLCEESGKKLWTIIGGRTNSDGTPVEDNDQKWHSEDMAILQAEFHYFSRLGGELSTFPEGSIISTYGIRGKAYDPEPWWVEACGTTGGASKIKPSCRKVIEDLKLTAAFVPPKPKRNP